MTHSLAQLRRALIPFFAIAALTFVQLRTGRPRAYRPEASIPLWPSRARRAGWPGRWRPRRDTPTSFSKWRESSAPGSDSAPMARPWCSSTPKRPACAGSPPVWNGQPVSVVVLGEIRAAASGGPRSGGHCRRRSQPQGQIPRPVPIGVSTGNQGECSAGTIGARVKSGSTTYALSNNHVYGLENSAPLGSNVLQPGRYDLNCASGSNALLGKLSKFVKITFSTSASNKVDAAIAAASTSNLARSTPSDGYGTPRASIVAAALNQTVQKYGRTTGLTTGKVVGLNATVNVGYSHGTARFVGQIIIRGTANSPRPETRAR